ncbi:MAG: aminotransferase class I/II-fold pyridoxal phosphate-dependent enzyme [Anaerolineae bacterium]|nr:aminotransferase class I/II-fold pyridoxal phosphate-dependent enzyme [Anaerolineae bacterium]
MSTPTTPRFVVPDDTLIPVDPYPGQLYAIPPSRMFLIKLSLNKYQEQIGPDAVMFDASQGDGGASLPGVPLELLDRAHELLREHGTGYDFPFGADVFRRSVVEQYWQLDSALGYGPANVLAAVGGRDALIKAYTAMIQLGSGRVGDAVIVSRVPWISYNWGPYAVGANVLLAPGDAESAWQYSEDTIRESVEFARQQGREVIGIVITSPDNPTGHTLPLERQIALGQYALSLGVHFVLYDWMYHYITEGDPASANTVLSAFEPDDRARVIILDGLTKSLGASNVRNAHLIASEPVIKFISGRASHGVLPHFHGQAVAMAAYERGFRQAAAPIIDPTNASRRIVRRFLTDNGYHFILGDGGYYAFIHVGQWMDAGNFVDSFGLGEYLAAGHGIAVVPGAAFSAEGNRWVRFSYALPPEVTKGALERFHAGLAAVEG